ncbi:MAG: lytic transglycosylase domain-containing protein [Solirubrobacteraceae bacterium]
MNRTGPYLAGAVLFGVVIVVLPLGLLLFGGAAAVQASCINSSTGGGPVGPLTAGGVPAELMGLYTAAAGRYGLGPDGWSFLAAINRVETNFGTDLSTSSAGAVGWMQFMPSTWAEYGVTPSGAPAPDGPAGWNDPADAIYSAANLLHASGAPGDWQAAIYAYNHAVWYVSEVESYAAQYRAGAQGQAAAGAIGVSTTATGASAIDASTTAAATASPPTACAAGAAGPAPLTPGSVGEVLPSGLAAAPTDAPQAVKNMIAAGNELISYPYSWGGGHCEGAMSIPPGPASTCPGEQENGAPGYDCSSATSFVLWGGGLGQSLLGGGVDASGALQSVGAAGAGQWVTVYAGESGGQGHAFVEVAGLVLDTVHGTPSTPAGTGPRWQTAAEAAFETQTGSFQARHPVGL